jgi:hypothetical protein
MITDDNAQLTVQRSIHEQGASGGMRDKRAAQRFRLRLDGILRLAAEPYHRVSYAPSVTRGGHIPVTGVPRFMFGG